MQQAQFRNDLSDKEGELVMMQSKIEAFCREKDAFEVLPYNYFGAKAKSTFDIS